MPALRSRGQYGAPAEWGRKLMDGRSVFAGLPRIAALAAAMFAFVAAGCATAPNSADREAVAEFAKFNDPAEPTNRAIFEINRGLDRALLKPVARSEAHT